MTTDRASGSPAQYYHDSDSKWSVSSYDIPHFLRFYSACELPLGKGKRYLSRRPAASVLGHSQANAIPQSRSGQPYSLSVPEDVANFGSLMA